MLVRLLCHAVTGARLLLDGKPNMLDFLCMHVIQLHAMIVAYVLHVQISLHGNARGN